MRQILLATTALVTTATLAAPALADTTISSTSNNLATATVNSGAADNIVIPTGITVSPASGTAVTINSSNTVSNAGTITFTDVNSARGITATGGLASGITNSGTINLGESYTQTDSNGDGVVDGATASGSDRYGVLVNGAGTFTGAIANSGGTITVTGNGSAGIYASAPIAGSVTNTGTITVKGDNSYGVRLGAVSGNVAIGGTNTITGAGSVGYALTGDVGGTVVVHGSVQTTGYSQVTLPSTLTSLTSQNLLQGGPALLIGGNVAGGVRVGASLTSTTDTTVDTDGDGIADSTEGAATLTSYGSAPALQIGSATNPITLGATYGGTAGLVIDGTVAGSGVYAGFNGTGVQIGGLGGTVTVTGGMIVTGSVRGASNGATGIGVLIGNGAIVPSLTNSGTIGGSSVTTAGGSAQAILIDTGANLPAITNSGTISAVVSTTGGAATAILDRSGTLTSVTNSGVISASDLGGTARAIDASANGSGFTLTQTGGSITGAIVVGNGNNVISSSAGALNSAVSLGTGNNTVALSGTATLTGSVTTGAGNDTVTLADTSSFNGALNTGSGADTLMIGGTAKFSGTIANSAANLAVSVQGGTFALTTTGTTSLASLSVNGGTLGVVINPTTGTSTLINVAGATTIAGTSTIGVTLSSIGLNTGTFTVLRSATMTGSGNFALNVTNLPYLLTGSLATSDTAGTVNVSIARKSAAAIGMTRSEAQAYDSVFAAIGSNATLSNLFLGITDRDATLARYRQLLPDHAGGVFDTLTSLNRLLTPGEGTPLGEINDINIWAQQAYTSVHQDSIDTPGYKGSGFGITTGADVALGNFGRFGLSAGYLFGTLTDGDTHNEVRTSSFQGGPYWIGRWGSLQASASGTAGYVSNSSSRYLSSTTTTSTELLSNDGHWHGLLLAAIGKLSYELHLGDFYLRPSGTISYFRLTENAYQETGGGVAFDLTVQKRKSSEAAVNAALAAGVQLGKPTDENGLVTRLEVEGGRRSILSSNLGPTTANFTGGQMFSLDPEDRVGGYTGTARVSFGNANFKFVADGTYEERTGYHDLIGRVGLRGAF